MTVAVTQGDVHTPAMALEDTVKLVAFALVTKTSVTFQAVLGAENPVTLTL